MLFHGIRFIPVAVLILQQPPYDGKQYGRKPIPMVVIFSPDDIAMHSMIQRLQFGSLFGNACGDVWVLKRNHGAKIGGFLGAGADEVSQLTVSGFAFGRVSKHKVSLTHRTANFL
jgi:hypothetical protein